MPFGAGYGFGRYPFGRPFGGFGYGRYPFGTPVAGYGYGGYGFGAPVAGFGYGAGGGFTLIVVLFILLVIIGALYY